MVLTPRPEEGDEKSDHPEGPKIKPATEWASKSPDRIVFVVDSINDAGSKLLGCPKCIKKLHIQGHGAPGYQNVAARLYP